MMNNLNFLPILMFILSMMGIILNSSNMMLILMCIEMMLLSLSLNFLILSYKNYSLMGQIITMYMITVAAVESAMGLSIMMAFYKLKGSISVKFLNTLKG